MMSQSPALKAEVLERADGYAILAWRRLMLLVWRGPANAAAIERFRGHFESWATRQPGGAAFLIVVPRQITEPPNEETRAAMERTASSPIGAFRGMATLIEAEGFIAASVRSLMIRLTSRHSPGRAPSFFRTAADAAAWASALLEDPDFTAAGLEEAIRVARRRG
jgi:hypothetical protein